MTAILFGGEGGIEAALPHARTNPGSNLSHQKKRNSHAKRMTASLLAEREGFEPSVRGNRTLVFETSQFNHSCTSPLTSIVTEVRIWYDYPCCFSENAAVDLLDFDSHRLPSEGVRSFGRNIVVSNTLLPHSHP